MVQNECEKFFSNIFPFWKHLNENERILLCKNISMANFSKGENIHGANSGCTGGILIKSGCVRVYILSDEGKEVTLYRLYPGDVCMLSASCVISSITFDVFVDAEEDTTCYIINGKAFAEIANRNVYVENFALNIATTHFSDVIWVMQQILFMSFDKRLAIFLYDEMSKTGSMQIKLTHEQIAKYIGSAREVVSRMLKYFASEGIVEISRGGIRIIDKKRLQSLAI